MADILEDVHRWDYFVLMAIELSHFIDALLKTDFATAYLNNAQKEINISAYVVVFALIFGLLWVNFNQLYITQVFMLRRQNAQITQHVNVALILDEYTSEDASVGVFWAGAVPYYSGRYAIDFLGKSDKWIAQMPSHYRDVDVEEWAEIYKPGHSKYQLQYSIVYLKPTYVAGFSWQEDQVGGWRQEHYTEIDLRGTRFSFLTDSTDVYWDQLAALADQE